MNRKLSYSLTICFALLLSGVVPTAFAEELKGDEITTVITGKTISGYNIDDRKDVIWYFAPEGVAKLRKKNITWTGKWRIDETGRLCIQFQDPYSGVLKKEGCRVLARENGKLVMYGLRKDGTRAGDTMSVEKIEDGNTANM